MPRYEIACLNGHESDVWRPIANRLAPCPECGAPVELIWRSHTASVVTDDIPGGQWFENGFATPRKFYSHSEHRRALKEVGCVINAKWAGPHDKIMTNWAAGVSEKQLRDAAVLLSRGRVSLPEAEDEPAHPITVRTLSGPVPDGVTHG